MEQYLTFTDHTLWEVIVNGDSVIPVASASVGAEGHIPPKTGAKVLMGIKSRIGLEAIRNEEMQKTILKRNINFVASSQEGLDKTYDRFQKLISQLEIHGEVIYSGGRQIEVVKCMNLRSKAKQVQVQILRMWPLFPLKNPTALMKQLILLIMFLLLVASYADDVMFSFFANQSNAPQLDNVDWEQNWMLMILKQMVLNNG
ncbi:hypothetical protein Tco_0569272 [Tanacetum coccineum]